MKNRVPLCLFFSLLFLSCDISWAEPLNISSEKTISKPTNQRDAAYTRSRGISIFTEASSKLDVKGVSKAWFGRNEYMRAELAVSISRLNFKQKPSDFRRTHSYPVYGLFNIQMNYLVAPFAQFGLDLGDALAAIINSDLNEEPGGCCDINITAGLQGTLFRKISLSVYGRLYRVRYIPYDDFHLNRKEFIIPVAGIRVSYLY